MERVNEISSFIVCHAMVSRFARLFFADVSYDHSDRGSRRMAACALCTVLAKYGFPLKDLKENKSRSDEGCHVLCLF